MMLKFPKFYECCHRLWPRRSEKRVNTGVGVISAYDNFGLGYILLMTRWSFMSLRYHCLNPRFRVLFSPCASSREGNVIFNATRTGLGMEIVCVFLDVRLSLAVMDVSGNLVFQFGGHALLFRSKRECLLSGGGSPLEVICTVGAGVLYRHRYCEDAVKK